MNSKQSRARSPQKKSPVRGAMRLLKSALGPQEDAISLLKSQHEEVKALFKKIEKTSAKPRKVALFEELAGKLVAHDAIEREIFYPACERTMGMTDLLGEALVEHGLVEFSLYEADQARRSSDFAFKCKVLSEVVEHHVEEEENEFFQKVKKAFEKEQLVSLGERMKARFEEAVATGDFRTPLHKNLKQVLAGALKPGKRPSAKKSPRRKAA